jgi:hypothetical protein
MFCENARGCRLDQQQAGRLNVAMQGDSLCAPQGWPPPAAGPAGYHGIVACFGKRSDFALDGN